MESFKDYLLEWGFFKRKTPVAAPQPTHNAAPAPKSAATPVGGFTSRNPNDHPRHLARDLLKSEYEKHNNIPDKHHTDATRKRRDELESEVVRRGMPKRMRPEEHEAMKNRPKPKAVIHWTNEKGEKRSGY